MAGARDTINQIFAAIARGDVNGFETMIEWLPLNSCSVEMQDKYLTIMLKKAGVAYLTPAGNLDMQRIIYRKWIELNPTEETQPIYPKIFSLCDAAELRPLAESLNATYYQAIASLSYYFDESFVSDVLSKYDVVYGLQTNDVYVQVLDYLKPREHKEVVTPANTLDDITRTFADPNATPEQLQENARKQGETLLDEGGVITKTDFCVYLYEYIENKIAETAPFANRPRWILGDISPTEILAQKGIFEGYPDDPKNERNAILPGSGEFADVLLNNMNGMINEESIDDARSVLTECYRESDGVTIKLMLLLPVYTDLLIAPFDDDEELIRYYGPLNPFVAEGDLVIAPNARMLECTHFEHAGNAESFLKSGTYEYANPDSDGVYTFEDTTSWFTGNCDVCKNKIAALHHSVRMPRVAGGWYGCYCSWNCVLIDLPNSKTDTENELNGRKIIAHLVRYFAEVLNRVGIYDRLPPSEVEEAVDYSSMLENAKKAYDDQKKRGFAVSSSIPIPDFEY